MGNDGTGGSGQGNFGSSSEACFQRPAAKVGVGVVEATKSFDEHVQRHEQAKGILSPFVVDHALDGNQSATGRQCLVRFPDQVLLLRFVPVVQDVTQCNHFDKFDNLYIIDQGVFSEEATTIRKMDPAGNVTTFATGFSSLIDICIDPRDGITPYGVDNTMRYNDLGGIYRITADGQKTQLVGGFARQGYQDGPLETAKFYRPSGCVMDKSGNLYIADEWNFCVRKINFNSNTVTTLAGHPYENGSMVCRYTNGKGAAAEFCNFADLTIDGQGNIVVPDCYNHCIRTIMPDG